MLSRMLDVSMTLEFIHWAGPVDLHGLGILLSVGSNTWAKPNDMYHMWYFKELTKICAYDFMVMVSGTSSSKGKGLA